MDLTGTAGFALEEHLKNLDGWTSELRARLAEGVKNNDSNSDMAHAVMGAYQAWCGAKAFGGAPVEKLNDLAKALNEAQAAIEAFNTAFDANKKLRRKARAQ
jgi:hypothetical protein